jgi:hypothetical protein
MIQANKPKLGWAALSSCWKSQIKRQNQHPLHAANKAFSTVGND